jgi:hypothetical protein
MKKNRRSQRHKAEKFMEKAEYLLANFTWNKEERILLDIMVLGTLSMNDAREANWTEVEEGLNSVIIKGVNLELSEKSLADFREALKDLKDFEGNEIDPRNTLHKIFSHKTGKDISKTLLQSD